MMPQLRAILFDMDGTLTEPVLDFAQIKQEVGIGEGPILEAMAEMAPDERRRAETILHRHEDRAAADSVLNPGCRQLVDVLQRRGIRMALITRNRRASVQTVLARHGLNFEVLITREDGRFKPDPAGLLEACRRLVVRPAEAWMVGDGQQDIEAGHAAGLRTVWLSHGRVRAFAAEPWETIPDLFRLTELVESCLTRGEDRL